MTIIQNVGRLEPGATYIYERVDEKVYARKTGETERILIGEYLKRNELKAEWNKIIEASRNNPALQDALDRVKVIYELTKQQETVDHHPV